LRHAYYFNSIICQGNATAQTLSLSYDLTGLSAICSMPHESEPPARFLQGGRSRVSCRSTDQGHSNARTHRSSQFIVHPSALRLHSTILSCRRVLSFSTGCRARSERVKHPWMKPVQTTANPRGPGWRVESGAPGTRQSADSGDPHLLHSGLPLGGTPGVAYCNSDDAFV
jgi:hypothetical protein